MSSNENIIIYNILFITQNCTLVFEYIQSTTGEEEDEGEEENEAGEEDKEVISPDILLKDIQVLYHPPSLALTDL